MGIGIKPQPSQGSAAKPLAAGAAPAPVLQPHQTAAAAIAKSLGGKISADLPVIPDKSTPSKLCGLVAPAWAKMGEGAKPVLSQDEVTWFLKLAAHPQADQTVHDEIAKYVSLSPPLTPKVASSGVTAFLLGLASPSLQSTLTTPPTASTAAAKKTVGTSDSAGPLQSANGGGGNALSSRLALMTGGKTVKSTKDAVAELKAALAEGRVPASLPMNALEKLGIDKPGGLVLRLDGCKVAGQRVVIRKIVHPDNGPGLEFQFKLRTGEAIRSVDDAIAAAGGTINDMRRESMTANADGANVINPASPFTVTAGNNKVRCRKLESSLAYSVEVVGDNQEAQAVRGSMRLRVFGEGKALNANFADAVVKAGLGEVFADSTTTTQARANQLRVLWQRAPQRAQEFAQVSVEQLPQKDIDAALKAVGIDPKKAATLPAREVFPGHFTTVNPTQADEYRALGVQYLFAGVRTADAVVKILAGDGLMSTMERYERGIIIAGASSASDIETGGADYVFTRMVTNDAKGASMSNAFGSGSYQIQIDAQVLERTDWFAYADDRYGNTKSSEFTERKYGAELIASMATKRYDGTPNFATSNEVMFHRGVSKEQFTGILADCTSSKYALIAQLNAVGVTTLAGKPLDEAIKVQTVMLE